MPFMPALAFLESRRAKRTDPPDCQARRAAGRLQDVQFARRKAEAGSFDV